MSVADGAYLRAVVQFDLDGKSKAQNRYHFVHETGTVQDEDDVVDAIVNFWADFWDNLTAYISNEVTVDFVNVYELVAGEWEPIGVGTSAWVGAHATDRVPSAVSMMIKFYKDRTGYADRKYVAGMTEAHLEGDTWASGVSAAVDQLITDLRAGWTDVNGVVLSCGHFKKSPLTFKTYTGGTMKSEVVYMTRRQAGRGLT